MKKAAAAFTLPTGCAVLWLCRDASRVRERGSGGGQRQAANKQNKCVFAVRGPTNEQNNKTQSLNAKQVFLVCSFPPPWPKPKAQARHSHRPHTYIDMHTHTHTHIRGTQATAQNKTTATIEFIVVSFCMQYHDDNNNRRLTGSKMYR